MVQAVANYETSDNKRAFVYAVFTRLADLEAGRELSLAEAKAQLGAGRAASHSVNRP